MVSSTSLYGPGGNLMMNFDNVEKIIRVKNDEILLTTDPLNHSSFPKPKEFIEVNENVLSMIWKVLPFSHNKGVKADFLLSETIPMQDIEIRCENFSCQLFIYKQHEMIAQFKNDLPFFIAGEIKITSNIKVEGKPRQIISYSPLLIFKKDMCVSVAGSFVTIPALFENADERSLSEFAECLKASREMSITVWLGIQLALLNPVIKERTRIETVPDMNNNLNKKKGKGPKRYVKKVTIGDISDMNFGQKRKNNITEPFWWVSGHWREYKSGKKVFIQGYWKGPFREFGNICESEPRERELVVE